MKIFDISWPISKESTTYKDKVNIKFVSTKTFDKDEVRETQLDMSAHTGTHVDAPAHFLNDGITFDQISLAQTIGGCRVVDMTHASEAITAKDLAGHEFVEGEIVLFKTANSLLRPNQPFVTEFVYLTEGGAQHLADQKIKAVGIDYLGIERNQPGHETHKVLMRNNITIIEGLRLGHVDPGVYFLWCLPLALVGTEAAPARAVLIKGD